MEGDVKHLMAAILLIVGLVAVTGTVVTHQAFASGKSDKGK